MDFHTTLAHQRGSALVFALGLCTLVVILSTTLILGLYHDMRRYERLDESISAMATMHSATVWARAVLSAAPTTMKLTQTWKDTLNGMEAHAVLVDLDGLFNINTLMDENETHQKEAVNVLERLVSTLGLSEHLVVTLTAHRTFFPLVSEIQQALALSTDMYNTLLPYVRANDMGQRVMNVNTMPPALLAAVLNVDEGQAAMILAEGPYASAAELNQVLAQMSITLETHMGQWLKFDSQQYLVQVDMRPEGEKGVTRMYTVLIKSETGWSVVYQSIGVRL